MLESEDDSNFCSSICFSLYFQTASKTADLDSVLRLSILLPSVQIQIFSKLITVVILNSLLNLDIFFKSYLP